LRNEESEADEIFVKSVAENYNVKLHVKKFNTEGYAEENKLSIQVAARELRYSWFDELLENGHNWLLTAHHLDDNVETVLMNFFRGTGITGLRGILPKNKKIIRPLLIFSKDEILQFAKQNNLQWREDSSNALDKYSRNYFRQTIIPSVTKIFPEAVQNIASNIERFRDVETLYHQSIDQNKKKLLEYKGREVHIPVLKLQKVPALHTVVYEIVKDFNFSSSQVSEIIHLLDAEQGKFVRSSTHRIIKNRNWLIIADNKPVNADHIIVEEGKQNIQFNGGELKISINEPGKSDKNAEQLDTREIKYPLVIRKWKQGDYFYPLGMNKKKKVSRFLIDKKISPVEKENIWVIETGKRICMILGQRIDDRFKMTPSTKQVLTIEFKS
jgi:tRNA(Ile)-lysidine synthase